MQLHQGLSTDNTIIEVVGTRHTALLYQYHIENKDHLAPWEPLRDEAYYSFENTKNLIVQFMLEYEQGSAVRFVALSKDKEKIIAVCNFTNIVYGPFQACNLGYSMSHEYQGQGIMKQVLALLIKQMFNQLGLHRIMANYMPSNTRSGRLLESLGFEREGLAKSYLKIAGSWQDHVLTSILNPLEKVE